MERIASAVAGYVAGALSIALIAGTVTFIVLRILGVPFAGPLAVLAGFMSLIPLIGATIAAVLIGIVTLFNDFPTDTIVWTVWAIVYQQLENNLVQPQIQKRTVERAAVRRARRGAVRQRAARRARRARRDPRRRVDPDRDPRVVDVAERGARAAPRDPRRHELDGRPAGPAAAAPA